jgi:hypothetical protein
VGAGLVAPIERSLIRTLDVLESQLYRYGENAEADLGNIKIVCM